MKTDKNIFEKFKKAIKGFFVFQISSKRQFSKLMITVFVVFVAVVIIHVRIFSNIQSDGFFKADSAPVAVGQTVNEKKLTNVLARFEEKAKARIVALTVVSPVLEPSK